MNMRWLGGKVTVLRKGEGAHRERWMARGCYKDSPSRTVARVIPLGRNSRPRGAPPRTEGPRFAHSLALSSGALRAPLLPPPSVSLSLACL